VFRPVARVTSALVIAPFVLFGSALAPVHAHEPQSGHSHAVLHSHFAPHHLESHDAECAEWEEGAEHIVWLDTTLVQQTAYELDPGPLLAAATFETIPPDSSWSPITFDDAAPVHGPPRRVCSLRGPPSFLA